MPGQKASDSLRRAFELAGAVAGVAFLIYFIGGLVTWQRFRTLGLAEEASVAALPREGLLIAGLLALKSPLILGLVTVLFYLGFDLVWRFERKAALTRERGGERRVRVGKLGRSAVVGLLMVGVLVIGLILAGLYAGLGALVVVAVGGALAIAAAWAFSRGPRRPVVAYGLFVAVTLTGGVIEYVQIREPPTHLEPAALFLDGVEKRVSGYFLAESSSFVYIATPRSGHPCQVSHLIRAFRRQDVAEIRLAPSIKVWPFNNSRPRENDLRNCLRQEAKAKIALANSP